MLPSHHIKFILSSSHTFQIHLSVNLCVRSIICLYARLAVDSLAHQNLDHRKQPLLLSVNMDSDNNQGADNVKFQSGHRATEGTENKRMKWTLDNRRSNFLIFPKKNDFQLPSRVIRGRIKKHDQCPVRSLNIRTQQRCLQYRIRNLAA